MRSAPAEIARAATSGALWTLGATGAARLVSLLGLALLARLLAPSDFGLIAVALVVVTYIETIGDLGTGAALIFWPDRQHEVASITFWINIGTGCIWFTAMYLLAAPTAAFFGTTDATPLLRALAWSFPLKALGNTHDALLQRDLRFRARAVPELAQASSKMLLAVPLALAGLGVWSLVWAQLASLALWSACVWTLVPWRPSLRIARGLTASMLRYGRGIMGVNLLAAITHHADVVIVGRMLGATALGYYQLAYKIPEMTVLLVVRVAGRVLFPAFSRLHGAGGMTGLQAGYLISLRYLALLAVPASAGLVVLAEPVVLTAFGPTWTPAVPILRALAVYMGLRALGSSAGDMLKAMARPGLLAGLGVLKATLLIPVLAITARHGPATMATALALVTALLTVVNLGVACRTARVRALATLEAIQSSLIGAAVLVVAAWAALAFLASAAPWLRLGAGVLVGGATYLAVVHACEPALLGQLRGVLARKPAPRRESVAEAAA